MKSIRVFFLLAACALAAPYPALAQAPVPAPAAAPADDPDLDINFSQPDFTIVTLPTTLRLPRMKSSFRVTHRFTRSLGQGDFGSLAEDFFSLDSGAVIGLEYRFGFMRGLQGGIRRTSDRTIAFFSQYSLLQQNGSSPVGLDVVAQIDGTNNFRDSYSPSLGVAISRTLGSHGAIYFDPIWVNNSNPLPGDIADDNDTFAFGVGARIRVLPTVYLVGEIVPRTGYTPGVNHATFGIEKRAGGHIFQLNFSNGFGTMMSQVARGNISNDEWYMGFQISRKFF
jgi:hypothetical protein